MKQKTVVLLALYNGERYIEEQLNSLLNQTCPIDRVLIGDDGSTDGGVQIAEKFIRKNNLQDRWFVLRNERNLGHAGNFIHLCSMVEEDYVFFCDQDDIWMKNKVETMISFMEENDSINLLYADVVNFTEQDYENGLNIKGSFSKAVERIPFTPKNYWFKGLGCGTCVKGAFAKRMLKYWTRGWEHDMFFWACAILMDSGYKYDYPVLYRRIHGNNASIGERKTFSKRKEQVDMARKRPDNLLKLLQEENKEQREKVLFIEKYNDVLRRRQEALNKRNPFIMLPILFRGADYYLHRVKGVIADIYLILRGE